MRKLRFFILTFANFLVIFINFYISTSLCFVGSFHKVLYPACHLVLGLLNTVIKSWCQMLHLKESLIDERLSLPSMDVLSNESIWYQIKQFPHRQRDIVPRLSGQGFRHRMYFDIFVDLGTIVCLFMIVCCTGKTLLGHRTCRQALVLVSIIKF